MQSFALGNWGITDRGRKNQNSRATIDMNALLLNVGDDGQPHSVVALDSDGKFVTVPAEDFKEKWHLGMLRPPQQPKLMPVPTGMRNGG